MIVTLSAPVSTQVTVTQQITEADILSFRDELDARRVTCDYRIGKQVVRNFVLWEGADYVAAGQYTDVDVGARLVALLER